MVQGGISLQIGPCQPEQGRCRAQAVLLQMDERPSQLDEAFVKISIRSLPVLQPQILQHVVRLVKFLVIELLEVTGVMSVQFFMMFHERGDAFALVAHADTLKFKG